LSKMLDEHDRMIDEWKKQLYYEHNRDTSLKTSKSFLTLNIWQSDYLFNVGTEIFVQIITNLNRLFECDRIRDKTASTTE
jgi:hypothetical protein